MIKNVRIQYTDVLLSVEDMRILLQYILKALGRPIDHACKQNSADGGKITCPVEFQDRARFAIALSPVNAPCVHTFQQITNVPQVN